MAAAQAATTPDTELFFDHVPLAGPADDSPTDRANGNAGAAAVALRIDIGLGTGFDGIGETAGRADVDCRDKIFIGREIIKPGEIVLHADGARRGDRNACPARRATDRTVGRDPFAAFMIIAREKNLVHVRDKRDEIARAFAHAGAAPGA